MEKQKYQLGDIVEVMCDNYAPVPVIKIGKVVSVEYSQTIDDAYCYGVTFNLNGSISDISYLSRENISDSLNAWIMGKVEIKMLEKQ